MAILPVPMPLEWSAQMDELFREQVLRVVLTDGRSIPEDNIWLGYPFDSIRSEVLRTGLADFDLGEQHHSHGDLSADDKVLLYCFTHM
jgi:hypothetical protein